MISPKQLDTSIELIDSASIKKLLLKNPKAALRGLRKRCVSEADFSLLAEIEGKLNPLLEHQATLIESRKLLSRSIGKARKAGEDTQAIVMSSKEISEQIDHVGSQIYALVEQVTCMLANNTSSLGTGAPRYEDDTPCKPEHVAPSQFLPLSNLEVGSTNRLIISTTTDAERWNNYTARHSHATHYHQYEWRYIIERNFSQTCWYFLAENPQGEIVGVAASVHMRSQIFGSFMLSMPFLIYGGPIADNQRTSQALAAEIGKVADQHNCTHTELRETHSREDWYGTQSKVAMVLELPDSLDILNKNLGAKLRSQIKRASKEQPKFDLGGSELIKDFYVVFSRKMRDLGTPVYPLVFFLDIAQTFPHSTHVAVVRLNNVPVAAAFLISHRDTLEIPWAASNRKFDSLGMNMFLYHSLLEESVKRGFRFFDFGRSTLGESTWRFKKQWGAKEHQLHRNFLSYGSPHNPGPDKTSAKFALAIGLWKKMPLWFTNTVGPVIARQLPW